MSEEPKRIYLFEHEHVALISMATRENYLAVKFGQGRVWLDQDAQGNIISKWAVEALLKMVVPQDLTQMEST